MRGKNKAVHTKDTICLTDKCKEVLLKCIDLSGEDVNKPYNLYNITKHIEKIVKHNTDRDALNLGTTMQVIDSIEYLKKEGLI